MARIIVHLGTGTYFGLDDDDVWVVDTNDFDFDPDSFEENQEEIVSKHGTKI